MNNAFYVVPVGGGDHVFASNILSECTDIARYFTRVEIVDMFGEVWRSVDASDRRASPRPVPPTATAAPVSKLPRRWLAQGLSSTSI